MNVGLKLEAIRALMSELRWDAVLIGGSDPHGSEYTIKRWNLREYVTGFSGSAGTVVVTHSHAGLWTDSRYFIQAQNELAETGVEVHRQSVNDSLDWPEWLSENLPNDCIIGVDGLCVSQLEKRKLEKRLFDKRCHIDSKPDFIDTIWKDRPGLPMGMVREHNNTYSGRTVAQKLSWLRQVLESADCSYFPVNRLDQIAWLLNIRCNDIQYNPVPISYVLVGYDIAVLFIDFRKVDDDIRAKLENDGVSIMPYQEVFSHFETLDSKKRILVDDSSINSELFKVVENHFGAENMVLEQSPLLLEKSIKNNTEREGFRKAYILDGVAETRFFYWLDKKMKSGERVTEIDASMMMEIIRKENSDYICQSFNTISAYADNAAMPHYSPMAGMEAELKPQGLYLVDSGAHYLFGTTDITRTIPLGPLTRIEREDYTHALKGMIALSTAVFPKGTPGCRLDSIARIPLWRVYRDYGHGTGHGVGNVLCVHEGPQSFRQDLNDQPFVEGMITSCEPGIYREGSHGIRHENMLLCIDAGKNDFGDWLCFETLTMVYLETAPLLPELLNFEESVWINSYNELVCERLSPYLSEKEAVWLKNKTKPI